MRGSEQIFTQEAAQIDAASIYLSLGAAIEYAIASPLSHSNACFPGRGKPARRRKNIEAQSIEV